MRCRPVVRAAVVLVSVLLSSPVLGQDASKHLVVHLAGSTTASGNLRVTIETGSFVTHALRIISEPSQTLQLTLVDLNYSKSAVGAAWLRDKGADGFPMVFTSLPEGQPAVEIHSLPSGDNVLAVWVYGTWPGGVDEDRLIAEAKINPRRFDFMTLLVDTPAGPLMEWCCSGQACSLQCVDCRGPRFTCCLNDDPGCCYIACGWVQCPC